MHAAFHPSNLICLLLGFLLGFWRPQWSCLIQRFLLSVWRNFPRLASRVRTGHEDLSDDGSSISISSGSSNNDRNDDSFSQEHSDTDSAYYERSPSTYSLDSHDFDFEQENGRTYHIHKVGKYPLPNDKQEQYRMDIHGAAIHLAFEGKHFLAPVSNPTSILDVGTGTGTWAVDVADKHEGAVVLGTYLSPIQPVWTAPNTGFQVCDMDDDWDMQSRFDLVHTRDYHYSVRSWQYLYDQAFQSLRPGGWVENQEFDLDIRSEDETVRKDGAAARWCQLMNEALVKTGGDGRLYPETMKQQMEAAGFINCAIAPVKVPIGPWPKDPKLKEAGKLCRLAFVTGMSGISVRLFTRDLGWSQEAMEIFLMEVRKEMMERRVHGYFQYYIVLGQKPPVDETSHEEGAAR